MDRRRLSGETIRDAMLAVSDSLNGEPGGPGVRPPLSDEITVTLLKNQWQVSPEATDHQRRSVYLFARRNLRFPLVDVFDRPDANASCARRYESTTAPQSLTLLNSGFSLEMARRLAGAILADEPTAADHWVNLGYQRALGRPPSISEQEAAIEFLRDQEADLKLAGREAGSMAAPLPACAEVDRYRSAALVDFCLALFNLNEFIYVD
jgi:hypothetical protein